MASSDWQSFFKGKRVTQLGLGLLGRGVNDAIFLASQGVELVVTDKKTKEQLAPSLEKLQPYSQSIRFVLGEHRLEDFRDKDFILKAAGVPLASPEIAEARKNHIPIEMDASLFAKLVPSGVTLVGITGTRGKSTTTHLIYHIVKAAGKRVFLGGNVRDMATLPLLADVAPGDVVVLELDSWQLQGFGEAKLSPHVAVFTSFMEDHLNYYGGSMDAYFADKAHIFKYQCCRDVLIVGEGVVSRVANAQPPVAMMVAKATDVPREWSVPLIGEHNRGNVACALMAARSLGITDTVIRSAIASFPGVPGRLEKVRTVGGVTFYNDTTATTPVAAAAGCRALSVGSEKHTVLICGGADKGLDVGPLMEAIRLYVKEVVVLPGSGSDRIYESLMSTGVKVRQVVSMDQAVHEAYHCAQPGDTVLLSPGFASFGPPPGGFQNEYDRGDQFDRAVWGVKG